jgi:MFS family permease
LKHPIRFIAILIATFAAYMDYTITNTALPTLQNVFHVNIIHLQWVFSVYCIVMAAFMVFFGGIGDRYGHDRTFNAGIIVLLLGSLLTGFSQTFITLIIGRIIQSLGVAVIATLSITLVHDYYQESAGKLMVTYVIVCGTAMALGPYIGGVLIHYCSWRWLFWINIPLLFITLALLLTQKQHARTTAQTPIDFLGTGLLIIILASFVLALIHGYTWLFLTALAVSLWLIVEKNTQHPLFDYRHFGSPRFCLAALMCICAGFLVTPMIFFLPLLFQHNLHYSVINSGLMMLIMPAMLVIGSPVIARIKRKVSTPLILLSALIAAIINILLYIGFIDTHSLPILVAAMILTGFIWSINNNLAPLTAAENAHNAQSGAGVGVVLSFWNITAAISVSVGATLFHHAATMNAGFNTVNLFLLGVMVVLSISAGIVYRRLCALP